MITNQWEIIMTKRIMLCIIAVICLLCAVSDGNGPEALDQYNQERIAAEEMCD